MLTLRYELSFFQNWDCVGVTIPFAWDKVHQEILDGFQAPGGPHFGLADDILQSFQQHFERSLQECLLGSVYLAVIGIYTMMESKVQEGLLNQEAERLVLILKQVPVLRMVGSRWPVHVALQHFRHVHQKEPELREQCKNGATGIDWEDLLQVSGRWSEEGMLGVDSGEASSETFAIISALEKIQRDPSKMADAAQEECIMGFLFLCTIQAVAAATRQTGTVDLWARAVDQMLSDLPFFVISSSQWPVFQVLSMLSLWFKGPEYGRALGNFQSDVYGYAGTHPAAKRFRAFGDLRLSKDEILPFGADEDALIFSERLSKMDGLQWQVVLGNWRLSNSLRPTFRNALDAVMQALRSSMQPDHLECGHSGISEDACLRRGCLWRDSAPELPACQRKVPKRKLLCTSFVWGQKWSRLIPRFVAWMHQLQMASVLVTVGKSCHDTCVAASEARGVWSLVRCWDPFLCLYFVHHDFFCLAV